MSEKDESFKINQLDDYLSAIFYPRPSLKIRVWNFYHSSSIIHFSINNQHLKHAQGPKPNFPLSKTLYTIFKY